MVVGDRGTAALAYLRPSLTLLSWHQHMTGLEFVRYITKIEVRSPRVCWLWTGARTRKAYGHMKVGSRYERAHRLMYGLAFGPIPDGLFVLHRCDNPPCVNPLHLFLGTNRLNMADASAKGRIRRGTKHHNVRLTESEVWQIRKLLAEGVPHAAIADRFSVHRGTVTSINMGENWGWLK